MIIADHCSVLNLLTCKMRCQLNFVVFILLCFAYISFQRDLNIKYFETFFLKTQLESTIVTTYDTDSDHLCAVLAARNHKGLRLFCYSEEKCMLSTKELLPKPFDPNSDEDYVKCFTTYTENDCEMPDGSILKDGAAKPRRCFSTKCKKGKLILPPTTPEASSDCPLGYIEYDNLGCVRLFKEKKTWCKARLECMKDNGDLASLDVSDSMDPLIQFYVDNDLKEDAWVGLERKENAFRYLIGGTIIGDDSELWDTKSGDVEPDCSEIDCWACGRARQKGSKLADQSCNDEEAQHFFICEVPIKK